MQLYYIRHCQSENNALWDLTGGEFERNPDPELTEVGRQQAVHLANFLAQSGPGKPIDQWDTQNREGFGLTHIYTSLMVRAVATGLVVSKALGIPLNGFPDIHESGGIYLDDPETGEPTGLPGKTRAYFEETYPELHLPDHVKKDGWWGRPFESRKDRRKRAQRVLDELWRLHGNRSDRVAMISHGGFYNHFLSVLFNIPWEDEIYPTKSNDELPNGRWMLMNNAAITRIDFAREEIRMIYQNRADFLPNELIT